MADRPIPVEELIDFPTSFAFKAIGHHTLDFHHEAVEATRSALPGEREIQHRTRLSRNGTYLSITVTANVLSADELRSVYQALWHVDGVITVL